MGIRGLSIFLKNKTPKAHRSLAWNTADFRGQRWGIDCQCLLHRAKGEGLSPLTVIAALLVRLRRIGVEPVFVFDGRPPAAKADVIADRRATRQAVQKEMEEVRTEMTNTDISEPERIAMQARIDSLQRKAPNVSNGDRDAIKRLLYAAGVLFVTANGEADDVLAYQCRSGWMQAVVSTDMDMLARGVPRLIVPDTADGSVMTVITLAQILTDLRLSYDQFVEACAMMGCDYSGREWRSWVPWAAVSAAAAGSIFDLSGTAVLVESVALLKGQGATWEEILGEKQRAKWEAGAPAVEVSALEEFCHSHGWPADWLRFLSKSV